MGEWKPKESEELGKASCPREQTQAEERRVAAWVGGAWGRMDSRVCVAEALCQPPETVTVLFIVHTLRQNENFNLKKIIKLEKRRLPRDSFYGAETKKGEGEREKQGDP